MQCFSCIVELLERGCMKRPWLSDVKEDGQLWSVLDSGHS